QCEESVVSLQCGRVQSESFDEIVVCTYTGWIFALTTEPIAKPRKDALTTFAPHVEVKVQQLRSELEELEHKVNEERQRYHQLTLQEGTKIAGVPRFAIQDQFTLDKSLACYTLSIELIIPIDYILLQSDVGVELIDVSKNSAVVSTTIPEEGSGNALLATYRCQANTTRTEMRIRSIEGQYGTLQAYICPKIHPKMCQVRSYSIKPLSLHQRIHEFDASRPLNTLRISGSFTLSEAHQWLNLLVSQVPERVPPHETVTFNFASTFDGGTQLQATYTRGSAIYRSDNISTIAIIRDVLSKEVTRRQIKVDIQCEMNEESIMHTLQLLHPKMEYQNNLLRRLELAQALKELADNGDDLTYLSDDMRELLESYDRLHDDASTHGVHLDRLVGIITDLYIDKERMAGRNGKAKVEELLSILSKYDARTLHNFFMGKSAVQQQ
ncbi:unnamed protein product, partial [Anisakis simplex]|uniref:Bardet-Biedl syndrome 7 protein (inferred by orthology to a human protein) n=1 Tax=Anisakis simplex TaxID=6269 RepID=A0A0M3IYG2_ANISI